MLLPLLLAAAGLADLGPVPGDAVRVYLVRHGEALSNVAPSVPDVVPPELDKLSDLGRAQSRRAALALRRLGVAAVLSSPAGRALETAAVIATTLGSGDPRVEDRLRPLDLGRGASGHPLSWDERIAEWKSGHDPSPRGGESLEQVGRRVLALVESLRGGHGGRGVVLVAHSEVIAAFVGHLGGTPGAGRYPPRVPNGSVTVVEAGRTGAPRVVLEAVVPPDKPSY